MINSFPIWILSHSKSFVLKLMRCLGFIHTRRFISAHLLLVERVCRHYGKNLRSRDDKRALYVTLGSCGCNLVSRNNEETQLACDQPALHRLLSKTLQTTAWQHFNPHETPNSLLSQQVSFQSTVRNYEQFWLLLPLGVEPSTHLHAV